MDIGNQVTIDCRLKRGNYVVESDNNYGAGNDVHVTTSKGIRTYAYSRVHITINHRANCRGECRTGDRNDNYRQERSSVREEDRVQREPLQQGCTEQIIRRSWSLAIDVGQARLVFTETNQRSTQVCFASLPVLVQGIAAPSRKELVLANESI